MASKVIDNQYSWVSCSDRSNFCSQFEYFPMKQSRVDGQLCYGLLQGEERAKDDTGEAIDGLGESCQL